MKIFALYTNILLTKKPDWLEGFVVKYQPRGLHVTLIQPRYIEEADIPDLKQRVSRFFSTLANGPMQIFLMSLFTIEMRAEQLWYARAMQRD